MSVWEPTPIVSGIPGGGALLSAQGSVLSAVPFGLRNSALGTGVFTNAISGNDNTALGDHAMGLGANTGNQNTAIGSQALFSNTSGTDNVAVGVDALGANTTGNNNMAVGAAALNSNTTGVQNIAIGANALFSNIGANNSVAIGYQSLYHQNATAGNNVAIGSNALFANTTGQESVAIGLDALTNAIDGGFNVAIGFNAGNGVGSVVHGSDSVYIGWQAGPGVGADPIASMALGESATVGANGCVAIGTDHLFNGAAATVQDQIVLGTANHHTTIPGLPAFVAGDLYLVVDASGNIHKSALGPVS